MKLKIVSDGTSHNTYLVNAETGEKLENVVAVEWSCATGPVKSTAKITLEFVEAELVGETG